jgi:hypothetical protein
MSLGYKGPTVTWRATLPPPRRSGRVGVATVSKTKELKSVMSPRSDLMLYHEPRVDTLSFGKRPKQGAFLETRPGPSHPSFSEA